MSLLLHRALPIRTRTVVRALSTTAPRCISLQLEKNDAGVVADTVPAYPYGPAQWYKQSDLGLYGGQRIQFGNNVGPKSKKKTRRKWHVNVFNKRLYSRALDRHIQLRVSTRVLRTIDKLGGLDNYLLGDKEARIKELGMSGWWLRWAIMQTPEIRRKFKAERKALGLPAKGIEEIIREEMATEQGEAQIDSALPPLINDGKDNMVEPPRQRLKFRAGPRAHLYHTPTGWRRAKPSAEMQYKAWVRETNEHYLAFLDKQHTIAFEDFDALVKRESLSEREQFSLRKRLEKVINESAEEIVEAAWKRHATRTAISGVIGRERMAALVKKGFKLPTTRAEARGLRRRERREHMAMQPVKVESGKKE